MRLETNRLILRTPTPQDVDDYLEFRNSEFVLRYNAMTPQSRDRALAQFSSPDENCPSLVLELKETGKVIGMICIDEDSLRYGVPSRELSYFLNEAYARRGCMKEALSAVIAHLFETENLTCIAARCFVPNEASRALLESLHFTQTGTVPQCVLGYGGTIFDDTLYTLLREDFQK